MARRELALPTGRASNPKATSRKDGDSICHPSAPRTRARHVPAQIPVAGDSSSDRSAKEFAAELGVPESTYARYERATEGPDCGIPLSAAWAIADRLGESIDVVVGRESMDVPHVVTLDERADALGPEGRRMLADFMDYLEAREGSGGGRR